MSDLLQRMRRNTQADWTIKEVSIPCRQHGVTCDPPRGGGSHYKIDCPRLKFKLTIQARRPTKPVYIRTVVGFISMIPSGQE